MSDVLIPCTFPYLLTKRTGHTQWGWTGPVVAPITRYGERKLRPVVIIGRVPDDQTTLQVWDPWAFELAFAPEHEVCLPLRYRSAPYEEGISRALNYLVDTLLPNTRLPGQAVTPSWTQLDDGRWQLQVDALSYWTFGPHKLLGPHTVTEDLGDDAIAALGKVVSTVGAATL